MNINQLKYLIELDLAKSFSLAAEKLGISQPALSMQIRNLEEELDFVIIDRSRKPFELTPEGEVVIEKAREIVALADNLKDVSLQLSMADEGLLRIGIIPTVAPYLVPLFAKGFGKKYPGIRLDISEMTTEKALAELKEGKLDAAIVATPVEAKGIQFVPLFYEKFFLYLSEKNSHFDDEVINLTSLDMSELWYLQEGNCFQNQVDDFCRLAVKAQPNRGFTYRSNSIESLRRIVELHGGAAFIPELATITVPAEYEDLVKPIAEPVPFREISLAVNRILPRERLLARLTDAIRASLPPAMQVKPDGKIAPTGISFRKL